MWYDPNTNTIYSSEYEVRTAFQNISFAVSFSDEQAAVAGLIPLVDGEKPAVTPYVNNVEVGGVTISNGVAVRNWVLRQLTVDEVAASKMMMVVECDRALTAHLDATAHSRRYDNRITCALRAGYPGPFQEEGKAFAAWMDQCNAMAYQFLSEVQAGTRPMPSSSQELIDALPQMVWPS